VYPISIFRFKIILTLITAGKFTEAVMLLPITLLLNSVRVDHFNRKEKKKIAPQMLLPDQTHDEAEASPSRKEENSAGNG
jgi:hypothetical protein